MVIDLIKSISLKYIDNRINDLKNQFIEMGQLKSEFDIEKFTIKKEGNFIAHNFHFLMRQYHLALYESRRMLLDKEEKTRKLKELKELLDMDKNKIVVLGENGSEEKYVDIQMRRLENEIDLLDIGLANKLSMVEYFEKCRQRLIELNGGTAPTNKQYQEEEPDYWKWSLTKMALSQHKQATTGIQQGVWDAIDMVEELPLLNPNYQVDIGSKFDLKKLEEEIQEQKSILSHKRKEITD